MDTTNFNIVQNLWQKEPSYTLYNESQKPLTSPPKPSYYMYIPAKFYYIFKDGHRMSNLILLPVSYENVISQYGTGKTIDEISTSILNKNFYGKLGNRDLRSKIYGKPRQDDLAFELRVYPFLAIATHIEYSYKDNPNKLLIEKFITTPWNKEKLTDNRFADLENYTRNMAHFDENEIKISGDEIIYDTAFKYLTSEFDRLLSNDSKSKTDKEKLYTLMGIKWNIDEISKSEKNDFIVKMDKYQNFEDFQKSLQNDMNFNGLGQYLSNKVVPARDPLVPNY